ncbi:MAG: phospholipid scramblase 1 [Bogoriella megaspora]|nr:MAG: phospholipid scramblase 1 [Bogoriella megaspora]
MVNKITLTFIGTNFLFLTGGALLIAFSVVSREDMKQKPSTKNVANNLLLSTCPLTASLVNAIIVFVSALTAIPALILPLNRLFLKIHGWLVVVCAIFTMVVGLVLWFDTLKTRANLNTLWGEQPASEQSLLQMTFNCCGYTNSTSPPFVQDSTCTTDLVAAQKMGCIVPFTNHANQFLDLLFTAAFGIVGRWTFRRYEFQILWVVGEG